MHACGCRLTISIRTNVYFSYIAGKMSQQHKIEKIGSNVITFQNSINYLRDLQVQDNSAINTF